MRQLQGAKSIWRFAHLNNSQLSYNLISLSEPHIHFFNVQEIGSLTNFFYSHFFTGIILLFNIVTTCMVTITHSTNTPRGINPFGNKLYEVLPNEQNLVFSPISIHAALSLAYQGSTGETAESFRQNLEVPDTNQNAEEYKNFMTKLNEDGDVTIHLANKIYVQEKYKLKDDFKSTVKNNFFADGDNIDFSKQENAANTMNTWVKESTGGKIDHLIDSQDLNDQTRAVLLNAIYFKANWMIEFDSADTRVDKFFVSDSESFDCEMMHQKDKFGYAENSELDAKILKMKYKDERYSMVIVLPNSHNEIKELENELIHTDISNLTRRRESFCDSDAMTVRTVNVAIPKFRLESNLNLKQPLTQVGLGTIFENGEFQNIVDTNETLVLTKVVQKAFVEIDEKGSEAAAATGKF